MTTRPTGVRDRSDASTDRETGMPGVLLVDDEPAVLSGLQRRLRSRYRIITSSDPAEALDIVEATDDLAVVVSDMRMPGMNGAQLLQAIRATRPDVVRVLLTGYAEVETAVAAINEGQIFRFLSKPVPSEALLSCLRDAMRQHELVTAERQLLEETLKGSVNALIDALAMANPVVFGRAERVTRRLVELAEQVDVDAGWEIELAGMLAHIGGVSLPPAISRRLQEGDELSVGEQDLVDQLPDLAVSLLANIPRLENVREIIRMQRQRWDGQGRAEPGTSGHDIPVGARLLRVVLAYDLLEARGLTTRQILHELHRDTGSYDPGLLRALETPGSVGIGADGVLRLRVGELRPGMVLDADVRSEEGQVLCGRGQQLTERLIELLKARARLSGIIEPITVTGTSDG